MPDVTDHDVLGWIFMLYLHEYDNWSFKSVYLVSITYVYIITSAGSTVHISYPAKYYNISLLTKPNIDSHTSIYRATDTNDTYT